MLEVSMLRISGLSFFCLFFSAGFLIAYIGTALAEYPSEKSSVDSGQVIYKSNCAGCHGADGKGSGIGVDFTNQEQMKDRNSSVFFNAVSEGIAGTSMPAFGSLSESGRWDVVAYIWTFWADRASVESGKSIFEKNCIACHGSKGDGSGLQGAFNFTNLSMMVNEHPAVFFESVSNGVQGTAMPSWKNTLSEEERWDTVKYVWTFQWRDYPGTSASVSSAASPAISVPSPSAPSAGWYSTPAGAVILLVSLAMSAGIIYLFIRGLQER